MGTIKRFKLDTRSRNDNAGLGGATGRWGNVWKVKPEKEVFTLRKKYFWFQSKYIHNLFVVAEVSFQFSFVLVVLLVANDLLLAATEVLYPVEYKLPGKKKNKNWSADFVTN